VPAIRALTVVLTACVLVLLAPVGPASAGGPTSVLLSVPGEGRTASLYYTDAAYDELADLVGAFEGSGTTDGSGRSHETGAGVTLTWLIHDVTPWRVDRVYLQGDGAPWIASQVMEGDAESVWDSPVLWHQPAKGQDLTLLLNSLGVGQTGTAAESASPVEPGVAVPASTQPASAAPTPTDDTSGNSARDRAWWALGGLAGGVLIAAGWTRLRSARGQRRADGRDPDAEHPDSDSNREWLSVGR
jgi:hypothetical protein